ncbi:hypothetical protein MFLAVUS_000641 [Mucor flavus]|uniref:Peptide-O-fucosyltransferase n=1 Tax=Mucor flavus TaxID=439312 RepID=A0ABP9YK94_9FUNG
MVKYSFKWPNITSFNPSSRQQQKDVYKEIDQKYCGKDRCKFLLPITITEQESKAQLHFRQLAFMAGKIGRTIVLPNVYNSHFGSCLPNTFDFYYDKSWLDTNQNRFHYITMKDFKLWISERQEAGVVPTGQEIYMQRSQRSRLLKNIKNCFRDAFDFSGRPTVNYQILDRPVPPKNMNLTDIIMKLLSDEARQHEYIDQSLINADFPHVETPPVDVINLFYDRRYQFMSNKKVNEPISYNKRWVDIANNIASELKPYIAIHWRMERLEPVSNLLPCAINLVNDIQKLEGQSNEVHPHVFLLTDYPHLLNSTGAVPESKSFLSKELKPHHHEAIQYLYQHLNITLTTIQDQKIHYDQLPKHNWNLIGIDTEEINDRSVLGIIDKLVAMKAQWFFAGEPGVCAKSSSFTGRISSSRIHAYRNGDDNIIDPLKVFGLERPDAI